MAGLLCAILVASLATQAIGVHAVFGAFLMGVAMPRNSAIAKALSLRLEDAVLFLLLPPFFALTGMRTEIGLLTQAQDWAVCGVIILVATAGKLGGTYLAGRLTGLSPNESASLGVLMNTRGLVEIIVLNIGLELGVISPALFTMLVIMAIVTTVATTPLFRLVTRTRPWAEVPVAIPAPAS